MSTNIFLDHFKQVNEQDLAEDLIIESIQCRGMDVIYVQQEMLTPDNFLGESDISLFANTIQIEMRLVDVQNFNGDGAMFADWGMISTDQTFWEVSAKRFKEECDKDPDVLITEPTDGDLIYMPVSNSLWEINKVVRDENYYRHGKNYTFRISCQLYKPNHDEFDTDNEHIDSMGDITTEIDNIIKEAVSAESQRDVFAEELLGDLPDRSDDIIVDDRYDPLDDLV